MGGKVYFGVAFLQHQLQPVDVVIAAEDSHDRVHAAPLGVHLIAATLRALPNPAAVLVADNGVAKAALGENAKG